MARALGLHTSQQGHALSPPVLLVGNHISWIDIVVLCASTPVLFVSKDDVKGWPIIGFLTKAAKTLFIARGGNNTARLREDMLQRLQQGFRVVIFPEGTTTDGQGLRRFQPRLFGAAIDGEIPVQPFMLHYSQSCVAYVDGGPSLFGVLWNCVAERHIDVRLEFGPQLASRESRKEYAQQAQDWVAGALASAQDAVQR
jgi:1-acyl-sn-glycerol-3-phosphate acyltransferase